MVVGLSSGALGCAPVPTFSLYGDQGPGCADASDIACQPFGSPAAVSGLAQANNVEKPTLTSDELEVFFLSYLNDGGLGNGDVWYTTRTGVDASWAAAVPVPNVNTSWREASPAISADGNTLWLGSDRPGGLGGLDIWVSMRADAGTPWAPPVDVTELNSAADEIPRPPGASELVMMLSRRASASVPYQNPRRCARIPPRAVGRSGLRRVRRHGQPRRRRLSHGRRTHALLLLGSPKRDAGSVRHAESQRVGAVRGAAAAHRAQHGNVRRTRSLGLGRPARDLLHLESVGNAADLPRRALSPSTNLDEASAPASAQSTGFSSLATRLDPYRDF